MSKMSFNNFLGLLDFKISNLGAIKRFLLNLIRLISGDVNLRKANTFIYFLNPKVEEHNLEKVSDIWEKSADVITNFLFVKIVNIKVVSCQLSSLLSF